MNQGTPLSGFKLKETCLRRLLNQSLQAPYFTRLQNRTGPVTETSTLIWWIGFTVGRSISIDKTKKLNHHVGKKAKRSRLPGVGRLNSDVLTGQDMYSTIFRKLIQLKTVGRLENKPMCYPQQLGRSWNAFVSEPSGTCLLCVPEPSRTSSAICPASLGTSSAFWSGTSSTICTRTRQNLISFLHRNPPEPHQLSAPEPSGTSSAFCTGTLRNLLRILGLQLHQIAPKLFWAKDPIASFAVGEKNFNLLVSQMGILIQIRNSKMYGSSRILIKLFLSMTILFSNFRNDVESSGITMGSTTRIHRASAAGQYAYHFQVIGSTLSH